MLTEAEFRELLREYVNTFRGQKEAAEKMNVAHSYISLALSGRHCIGPAICEPLGYRKVIMFEKIETHKDKRHAQH